ncbi:MAG: hypothetical protein ACOY99_08665 [Pseudomonadota bacterium]
MQKMDIGRSGIFFGQRLNAAFLVVGFALVLAAAYAIGAESVEREHSPTLVSKERTRPEARVAQLEERIAMIEAELRHARNVQASAPLPDQAAQSPSPTPDEAIAGTIARIAPASGGDAAPQPLYSLHLASYHAAQSIMPGWEKLRAEEGDILAPLRPIIAEVQLAGDEGHYFRLKATGYETARQAQAACALLMARGQYCAVADGQGVPLR